ncbi:uncharacterized protein [Rutidosis leptorrhynchoides]|uniref:uncharacterized protein n=1 Tax=Rutidosis leptorrhynchoides TaxID=125765 RepID=UPI003A9901EA
MAASDVETLRNKSLPQKINIFIWRAIKCKIRTRSELDKRGIDLNTLLCPLCDTEVEIVDHILISCHNVKHIWHLPLKWWNFNTLNISNIEEAFVENQSVVDTLIGRSIWQATRWVCCYTIWKNRNNKIFSNKEWIPNKIITDIQTQSFDWISKRLKKTSIKWHQWLITHHSTHLRTNKELSELALVKEAKDPKINRSVNRGRTILILQFIFI